MFFLLGQWKVSRVIKRLKDMKIVGKGKIVQKMGKIPHFYCFPFPIRKCLIAYFEIREFMHYEWKRGNLKSSLDSWIGCCIIELKANRLYCMCTYLLWLDHLWLRIVSCHLSTIITKLWAKNLENSKIVRKNLFKNYL